MHKYKIIQKCRNNALSVPTAFSVGLPPQRLENKNHFYFYWSFYYILLYFIIFYYILLYFYIKRTMEEKLIHDVGFNVNILDYLVIHHN